MSTLTPLMSLTLPTIGIDSGLIWEQSINSNSGILDGHNHAVGSGNQVTPSGLNINTDLPINDNNITLARSVRFQPQTSIAAVSPDLGIIYVEGVDLYYNDLNNNVIPITSGGQVVSSSSGISSPPSNSASFSGTTLLVVSASNTPTSIKAGNILIGNTGVSGSFYVTLAPQGTIAASYSLYLPPVSPSGTQLLVIDGSGNMNPTTTVSSLIANNIGTEMTSTGADAIGVSMTSTGANAVAASRTRATGSSTEGIGGVAISSSSTTFSTSNSSSLVAVTGLSVTLTTSGRPVMLMLQSDGGNACGIGFTTVAQGQVAFFRGASQIGTYGYTNPASAAGEFPVPSFVDVVGAGTYNYTVKAGFVTAGLIQVVRTVLVAYEL